MTLAPGSLKIRSARPSDTPILFRMAMESYADTFGSSMTREELIWQLQNTKSLAYFDERITTDAILLAIIDSQMVGYIQITNVTLAVASTDVADQQLNALYVLRDCQGRGSVRAWWIARSSCRAFAQRPISISTYGTKTKERYDSMDTAGLR